MSLDLMAVLIADPDLSGWDGLGLAVQAYQKRALPVIEWLAAITRQANRRLMVRLVKGAYWDAEIKLAQERGLSGYPVFTRKNATDVSYLACAKRLFADPVAFYPAFATHNAYTAAAILELSQGAADWEFQRLHGMGEDLHDQLVASGKGGRPSRIYAPVGSHRDLLAYLVRRLLENGSNTSFVNRIADAGRPIESLLIDPAERILSLSAKPHPAIPLPADLYGPARRNSLGLDFSDKANLTMVREAAERSLQINYAARPLIGGQPRGGEGHPVFEPAHRSRRLGSVCEATPDDIAAAFAKATAAFPAWNAFEGGHRAGLLERAADLYQSRMLDLAALIVREGGRTQADAVSEVREAIDYLRYYAAQARGKVRAGAADRSHRRTRYLAAGGTGRLRLHQPVEFPGRHFYRGRSPPRWRRAIPSWPNPLNRLPCAPRGPSLCCWRRGFPAMSCTSCPAMAPSVPCWRPIPGAQALPSRDRPALPIVSPECWQGNPAPSFL